MTDLNNIICPSNNTFSVSLSLWKSSKSLLSLCWQRNSFRQMLKWYSAIAALPRQHHKQNRRRKPSQHAPNRPLVLIPPSHHNQLCANQQWTSRLPRPPKHHSSRTSTAKIIDNKLFKVRVCEDWLSFQAVLLRPIFSSTNPVSHPYWVQTIFPHHFSE